MPRACALSLRDHGGVGDAARQPPLRHGLGRPRATWTAGKIGLYHQRPVGWQRPWCHSCPPAKCLCACLPCKASRKMDRGAHSCNFLLCGAGGIGQPQNCRGRALDLPSTVGPPHARRGHGCTRLRHQGKSNMAAACRPFWAVAKWASCHCMHAQQISPRV